MLQIFIDKRGDLDFGDRILQFFLQREAQQSQAEQLKIQQGQFKLQQEQAQMAQGAQAFEQRRVLQQAIGTAAGLGAGRAEEAQTGAGQVFGALAGLPGMPGLGGLQQLGQAGQGAITAQPSPEQAISQLEDPLARSAAAQALEIQRTRADTRQARAEELGFKERELQATINFREAETRRKTREAELTAIFRKAQLSENKEDRKLGTIFEIVDQEFDAFSDLLAASGDPSGASLRIFGTVSIPTRQQRLARALKIAEGIDDPATLAGLFSESEPSVLAKGFGLEPVVIGAFEAASTRKEAGEELSNQDFIDEMFLAIDAFEPFDRRKKQEQKAGTLRFLRLHTGDFAIGSADVSEPEIVRSPIGSLFDSALFETLRAVGGTVNPGR